MSEPFRSAQSDDPVVSQPLAKGEDEILTPRSTDHFDLFATYYDAKGVPLTAEYLELDSVWNQDDTMKNEILSIEKYLQGEVHKGKLSNNTKVVKQAIRELEKKAGISQTESTNNRIRKLIAYIDFRKVLDA